MLYFEDALWIRENFWRDAIGTMYFVLGFFGIAFHLVLVSILPEISNFISRPSTMILSAQFAACIIQFFVVFVPVPAMIAVNKPYFWNEVMINVPAFLLVLAQCFAFLSMVVHGIYRNLKSTSPRAGVVLSLILATFALSFCFAVNICARTTIRRFTPSRLSWNVQEFETTAFKYLILFAAPPAIIFYIISIANLSYMKLFKKMRVQDEDELEVPQTIVSTLFYAVFDSIFPFLLCLGSSSTSPLISFAHVFLTAYWPVFTVIALDIHIRSALIYRIRGVFQPQSTNTPIVIRANSAKFSKF